ncbi:MAG: hypothetical protein NZ888_00910 [Candidatus Nitrosocaldus sp.]|nr:hypothetical protein [Candidatus Nitrosocaldus sp.]MDW7999454.1 helix-turn-helix domain-containing protein [Candidatus Nitrosocaldus sp.]
MASNPIARDNLYLLTKKLGLSSFESKAYICFFTLGNGLSAKDISKSTGIPLTRVYDVMKSLEEKALVTKNKLSKPVKYYLNDPAYSLMLLLNSYRTSLENEMTMLEQQIEYFTKLYKERCMDSGLSYSAWTLHDSEEAIYTHVIPSLIRASSSEVIIVGRNIVETLNRRMVEESIAALERGVQFRGLTTIDALDSLMALNSDEAMESKIMILRLIQAGSVSGRISLRISDLLNVTPFGIFDRERVGFTVQSPKTGRYVVHLLTDKKDVVAEFYDTFEDIWNRSMDIDICRLIDNNGPA